MKCKFYNYKQAGFTIVELIIVVVVIGILATLIMMGGRAYVEKTKSHNVEVSLLAAAAQMKQVFNQDGVYPESLPPSTSTSSGVTLHLARSTKNSYCLEGASGKAKLHISSSSMTPKQGGCPEMLMLSISPASVSMESGKGGSSQIRLAISNGTPPYSYTLSGGEIIPSSYGDPYSWEIQNGAGWPSFHVSNPNSNDPTLTIGVGCYVTTFTLRIKVKDSNGMEDSRDASIAFTAQPSGRPPVCV